MDDTIYIKGFINEKPEFYCWKHFNDLIGFPTRVFLIRNDTIYVTHPTLDVVPLSENCVDYEVLEDVDMGYHRKLKDTLSLMKKMGVPRLPVEKVKKLYKSKIDEQEEPKKSSKDEALLSLIDDFNNNEFDLEFLDNFMGGLDNFISILKNKGWLHLINPFSEGAQDIQNRLFYTFYKSDPNFIHKIVEQYLSDIQKVGDDYYYDADYSELADLFRTTRSDIGNEIIEKILSGEYDPYEYGGNYTDDEYRDVYDNLDHYAKSVVDEFIVNELKAMGTLKFSTYKRMPEFFEEIAEEQGTEEEIKLTDEVIVTIMKDKDCLEYLINKELDEVRSNLNTIYSSCYGDTLVNEWYDDLWRAIEGDVVDSRQGEDYQYQKPVWLKDGTRGTKTAYGRRYKVTKCLFNLIVGWLEDNKNSDGFSENTIEYFGGYLRLMKDAMENGPMDLIRVPRLDDYPDFRKVEKCINNSVESYF
jgi:hypothetical protein